MKSSTSNVKDRGDMGHRHNVPRPRSLGPMAYSDYREHCAGDRITICQFLGNPVDPTHPTAAPLRHAPAPREPGSRLRCCREILQKQEIVGGELVGSDVVE